MTSGDLDRFKVAIVLFDEVDILDFNGPLEVFNALRHQVAGGDPLGVPAFETTLLGHKRINNCECGLSVNVEMTFAEALDSKITNFDVLVVPGANPNVIQELIESQHPILDFITQFLRQGPKSDGRARTILTVCTGALVFAATGGLKNMRATTHRLGLDLLQQIEPSATVLGPDQREGRYVDGGLDEHGNRVVTAGGVTSGIDGSLYVGELLAGKGAAMFARTLLEIA